MRNRNPQVKAADPPRRSRCAIYTRKSTEEGLEQEFNSLYAQREAAEAFIRKEIRNVVELAGEIVDQVSRHSLSKYHWRPGWQPARMRESTVGLHHWQSVSPSCSSTTSAPGAIAVADSAQRTPIAAWNA